MRAVPPSVEWRTTGCAVRVPSLMSGSPTRDAGDRGPEGMAGICLERNLPWLYAGRSLRSLATSFLGVIAPLYLAKIGYSGSAVGVVFTLGSVIVAILVIAVGVAGDRIGRRPVLVSLGLLGTVGAAALALSPSLAVVTIGCGLSGVGRGGGVGSGGAWGPFFPAEQPLLAASVPDRRRTAVFTTIGLIGVLSGAVGSAVAFVPDWLHAVGLPWATAYRLLFALAAAISLAVACLSFPLRDPVPNSGAPGRSGASPAPAADDHGSDRPVGLSARQLLTRLGLTNALNGFGVGFLGPILVYWFYRRYEAGPAEVGALYVAANALSALPYLGTVRLVARLGAVRAVVVSRALSAAILLSMAWAPTFALAAAAFILRSGVNSISIPARQSYVMAVAPHGRRGAIAAFGALPAQATASLSPAVAGALMNVLLDVPLYGSALFMGANAIAYWLSFRDSPPPEERDSSMKAPRRARIGRVRG